MLHVHVFFIQCALWEPGHTGLLTINFVLALHEAEANCSLCPSWKGLCSGLEIVGNHGCIYCTATIAVCIVIVLSIAMGIVIQDACFALHFSVLLLSVTVYCVLLHTHCNTEWSKLSCMCSQCSVQKL